jgi:hypothetical protein
MGLANQIFIAVGAITVLFGLAAFINPIFSRLINAPGGPRLKASIAMVVGAIILIVGFFYQIGG